MKYEFVQVSAHKENGDFALCSNLSLMDNRGMTPEQAEQELVRMAAEYASRGYTVDWTREEMGPQEIEFYGELFHAQA